MQQIQNQRHLFDIPAEVAYFNCAYYSPLLNASRDALRSGVASKSRPWERTPQDFFNDAETIRGLAAGLFGGDADGYAVIPAASYGISTAARAIEPFLKPGDRILVMAEEFPSNVLPWQRICRERGAVLTTVPKPARDQWTPAILEHIDKHVKVAALSTCHWTNGAAVDLHSIAKACRAYGISLVIDATQTLGAVPFSVNEIKPDFLAAAGYKWLLGPYGFGLLYVADPWRNSRPLEETWIARDKAEDFTALVDYSDAYMPGARRFEVGEKCTPTILPGVIAALEQIKIWGIANIAHSLSKLNAGMAEYLESFGFLPVEPVVRSPHMFGTLLPEQCKGNLVAELKKKHIYISQRGNALRFAPHLHVNDHDVERLKKALQQLLC